MKRETLIKNLQKNVMQITFNKVSGEERVMHCTLNETFVPETSTNNKRIMMKYYQYGMLILEHGGRSV